MTAKMKSIDPILIQRAITEALEGKIEALRAVDELSESITLKLYFWDDLAEKHPDIFRSATLEDVVSAISVIEKESKGHLKLVAIKPSEEIRNTLSVLMAREDGRPFVDISNLYWKIQYLEKSIDQETTNNSQIFLLTPRDIHSFISGKERLLTFQPKGVQHKLLEWFSENKGFTETKTLAEKLNTTPRTISTEIAKLRKKAEEAFAIDDFIESSKGEGYKINKKIKIRKE